MLAGLFESRGWKKFRKRRVAMVSLGVIGLYLVLALWTVGTNALNAATGGALVGRPVLGALLRESAMERIGPAQWPGFGGRPEVQKRFEAWEYLTREFDTALRAASQAGGEGERSAAEVLAAARVGSRRIAPGSLEELRAVSAQAAAVRGRLDELSAAQVKLGVISERAGALAGLEAAARAAARSAGATGGRALENAAEDWQFGIEDLVEASEVAWEQLPEGVRDAAGSAMDAEAEGGAVARLRARAAEIEKAIEAGPEAIAALLGAGGESGEDLAEAGLAEAAGRVRAALRAESVEVIDELEPIAQGMFPEPAGLAGLVHDLKMLCGTDRQGRSILVRALYSAKVAVQVGVVTGLVAVVIGSLLGAAAAYFGGWFDHAVNWVYATFTSIPSLVLLVVLAFMFTGTGFQGTLIPLYASFGLTYWIGPCRVVRGEAMKIKELEYVQAAVAMGSGRWRILLRHILPNTVHLMFINFSLLFIGAVKGEVILTFLGLGLKDGASWGLMISQSKAEVATGYFWQIGTATVFMFLLVLAFNILTDALQDAFDPKHVG